MSVLHLQLITTVDYYGFVEQEEISSKDDCRVHFHVSNLNECPEDAIIGRDLFNAYDFINTLKLGMELGQEGYTKIDIEVTDEEI